MRTVIPVIPHCPSICSSLCLMTASTPPVRRKSTVVLDAKEDSPWVYVLHCFYLRTESYTIYIIRLCLLMLLILHCLNAECDISGTLEIRRKPFSMWQIGSKCKCSATTTPANHPGITRHVKNTVYTSASWIAISLWGAPFFWLILTWTLHVVHFKTAEGAVSRLWRASVLNIVRAIFYMTWFSLKRGLMVGWGGGLKWRNNSHKHTAPLTKGNMKHWIMGHAI